MKPFAVGDKILVKKFEFPDSESGTDAAVGTIREVVSSCPFDGYPVIKIVGSKDGVEFQVYKNVIEWEPVNEPVKVGDRIRILAYKYPDSLFLTPEIGSIQPVVSISIDGDPVIAAWGTGYNKVISEWIKITEDKVSYFQFTQQDIDEAVAKALEEFKANLPVKEVTVRTSFKVWVPKHYTEDEIMEFVEHSSDDVFENVEWEVEDN
jgi:hypothetical protein